MKLIMDLSKSYSNYYWRKEENLKDYIEYMKMVLWGLYKDNWENERPINEDEVDRLYDILDMFETAEIVREK